MRFARHSMTAVLVSVGIPTALVAQDKLVARGSGAGFSMTIEGTKQGVFGAKGGAIPGLRFSYAVKSPRDLATVSEIKQYTEVLNGQTTVLEDVSFTFRRIEVQDPGTKTMATDDWMPGK